MKTFVLSIVSICLLACVVGISMSQDDASSGVTVAVLDESNWDELVPHGKEVDAIYGDVVLRNQHLVAVIAKPVATRNANMTVRAVGGCLIDLTARDHQSDQLSCFYPGKNALFTSLNMIEDGDIKGVSVKAGETANRPALEVIYSLGPDSKTLTITSKYTNSSEQPKTVEIGDSIRADGGKEDMVKSPNGTGDLYSIDDRYWGQAYGIKGVDRTLRFNSNSRSSQISYITSDGNDLVTVSPEKPFKLKRHIAAGQTMLDIEAAFGNTDEFQAATLVVRDAMGRAVPECRLEFSQGDGVIGVARCNQSGIVEVPLKKSAEYQVTAIANGNKVQQVALAGHQRETTLKLSEYKPGVVEGNIRGEDGIGLPCKVAFLGKDDTPTPDFGPETAEFAVKNLRYAPHGVFRQLLQPGKYDVIISRGPEFDAVFTEIEVAPGSAQELAATLNRTVQTPGWVSGEFHSHSSPSGDNTGSQFGRVLNLVCEHLEFTPCTEHNRISTYQPHIDKLEIGEFISTISGMELTGSPLPLNHQNTFPLHHHPHQQDGGGPQTDTDITRQIQRLAAWDNGSEKLIQQNHPDVGWLFYDANGDGQHDHGYDGSFPYIDAMEIHPISGAVKAIALDGVSKEDAKGNRIFKWLQLINQGHRITGVVNTDAHYNFHGSGWLRNWIQSSTDDPAKIDHMEMVHASEEGRLVMSNGPYLEVWATAGDSKVTVGQDLKTTDGKVNVAVKVQCPNWHDINTVAILVNGKPQPDLHFSRDKNADMFGPGVIKFDHTIPVKLETDAHLVVVAAGVGEKLGPVYPPQENVPPVAVGNPIFVDVDGNGFQPNQDTLGLPLPVKGD